MADESAASFLKAIENLIERKLAEKSPDSPRATACSTPAPEVEALARAITPFTDSPDQNLTFETWFSRYKSTFLEDGKNLDEAARVRLLLRRLDGAAYARYANLLRPRDPAEISFEENVRRLSRLFGKGESFFSMRRKCLQYTMDEADDWGNHGGLINSLCEDFQISACTPDQFKALMFCISIRSDRHISVREQLLAKLETDSEKINVDFLIDEARRLSNVKKDARLDIVPAASVSVVSVKKNHANHGKRDHPPRPCFLCGAMHFTGYCPPAQSSSGKPKAQRGRKNIAKKRKNQQARANAIHSERYRGRRYLTPVVNGQPLLFQLDSAADVSVMTRDAWEKIGKPALQESSLTVRDAQANRIQVLGQFEATIRFHGKDVAN
ncbi:uncharacterized protein K02A2.6-like [Phlebotomus argentipes]|uniref:uncharacterized protein K02A2.6-like n=1 Tax=Phlebotomus argentipes TaxID=94469 RepID=UPI0028930FEA|nr:uncharacterized protein K02A2.6-like [Phlebotomus argentipes]